MEGLKSKKAWLFLAPVLILMAIFTFWPMINTFIFAFQWDNENFAGYNAMDAKGGATYSFSFKSFIKLFNGSATSKKFLESLLVTTVLLITVPISVTLALLIAVALNSIKALQKLFQTIYFLPYVTNSLAIGAVFAVMFQSTGQGTMDVSGIMNTVLGWFGVPEIDWLGSSGAKLWPGTTVTWANIAVLVVYIVWNALPFKILIFMGALASMNKQYYDAAKIDGANKTRIFTKITVPLLSPMISYLLITGFIGAFKEYTAVVGVFGENMGEQGKMNTVVGRIYAFIVESDYGYASAMSLVLFAIIMVFTGIQALVNKKRVYF